MLRGLKDYSGLGVLLVAIGASFWGTDAVIREPMTDEYSSTSIVLGEHVFLALYAFPVLYFARDFLKNLSLKGWLALLVISWGGSGLATVLFTEGFAQGNPTTVILLQKTQPLIVILLAGLLLKERLDNRFWPLFGVALVGTYLVSFNTFDPFWTLGGDQVQAAGLALGAAALWGASTVMGRYLLGSGSFSTVTAGRFLFALPFLFGLALWRGAGGETVNAIQFDPGRLFLMALIPGLLAMLIYYQGLSRTEASYATLAELAFPATAVIVNWFFLDARITLTQGLGFAILWAAIAALSWLPDRQSVVVPSAEPVRET